MFVLTLITVILALPINLFGVGQDTVVVHGTADSIKVCVAADSTNRTVAADFSHTYSTTISPPAAPDTVKTISAPERKDAVTFAPPTKPLAETTIPPAEADTVKSVSPPTKKEAVTSSPPAEKDTVNTYRPILGISTNLPYDITWVPGYGVTSIPSLSIEFYPKDWKHFTLGADVEWPMWKHWDTHRFMQINNITLWTRRYFRTRACEESAKGFYLLANINAARFGIGFDANRGWQGEGLGASLGGGHRWTWGRFFIDAGLALGYFYARYDPYVWGNDTTGWYYYDYTGDPENFVPRRMALHWFGPTRVYVSIGFDIAKKNRK